jgi:Protein of unknown function (DUF3224)
MSSRFLAALLGAFFLSLFAGTPHLSIAQTMTKTPPAHRDRANATVTVQHSTAKSFDSSETPKLNEISIEELFEGDIEGESVVRALQIANTDHSATMLSLQRVRGSLGKKKGTFVLEAER